MKKLWYVAGIFLLSGLSVILVGLKIDNYRSMVKTEQIEITETNQVKEETNPIQENSSSSSEQPIINEYNNTMELLNNVSEITNPVISEDKIEFSNDIAVKTGEKIAVWIYSEPKFLGYFIVKEENGKRFIDGLKEALEKTDIDLGKHHIALQKDSGNYLGYIKVEIKENSNIQIQNTNNQQEDTKVNNKEEKEDVNKKENRTTKEEIIQEEIPYQILEEENINSLKGTRIVFQKGQNGSKSVKYLLTFDDKGQEISREKVDEVVISEPIDEIIKVGISDYNLNTDTYSIAFGMYCTESQVMTDSNGISYCNDSSYSLGSFYSIELKGTYYATCIGDSRCTKHLASNLNSIIPLTFYKDTLTTANYNGQKLIFDTRAGDLSVPLTKEICERFQLSCGSW